MEFGDFENAMAEVRKCRFRLVTVGVELAEKQLAGEIPAPYEEHPDYKAEAQRVVDAEGVLKQFALSNE